MTHLGYFGSMSFCLKRNSEYLRLAIDEKASLAVSGVSVG